MSNKEKYGLSNFIGTTGVGLPFPVFFDPHYPISINRPPVTVITGEPGSGKTMASMLLAAHSAISGKSTVILDPKGDFINLKQLESGGILPGVTVWSIFNNIDTSEVSEENYGMLDPTYLTDDIHQNASLTIEVMQTLIPSITEKQMSRLIPIVQDTTQMAVPSFSNIERLLKRDADDDIRALGFRLDVFLKSPIAKILVNNKSTKRSINLEDRTVVMSLLGLNFPNSTVKRNGYSNEEALAVVVMQLLSHLIFDLMKKTSKSKRKTLVIDEAWAVAATKSGKKLIADASLLGRSLNMATILTTQSPLHLESQAGDDSSSIGSTISTRLAFKNTSKKDNEANAEFMRLPEGWQNTYESLTSGICLMQDCTNQLSVVQIILPPSWLKAFSTTPKAKKEKQ